MDYPPVVSKSEWLAARASLLAEEKAFTREGDRLSARRRRMPMRLIERDYTFQSEKGTLHFADLFEGRDQLIVYFNMLTSDHVCPGCSYYCDHVGNLSHLHARRTTFVVVSRASLDDIEQNKARLGWTFPWVSCAGESFYEDFVTEQGVPYGLAVFIRRDDAIYQTYFTSGRGVEHPSNTFGFLDITPWGRQEPWEESPPGWPQEGNWLRIHDQYKTT
jgi:predicted dithiol-disulfide oxidoreductase (DUF899 family)